MPWEILGGLAGAVIPGLGAQASAQMQRRWALQDLEEQNRYNSPAEQLRRLKEAGLPAASFFSGGVSSQSDQPRSTNVDPTLGFAEGMQNLFQNRIQKAQVKVLEADARAKSADADIKEIDAGLAKKIVPDVYDASGKPLIRRDYKDYLEMDSKAKDVQAKSIANSMAHRINQWEERYGDELRSANLANLASDLARNELELQDAQLIREFTRDFIRLYQSGDFFKSLGPLAATWLLKAAESAKSR